MKEIILSPQFIIIFGMVSVIGLVIWLTGNRTKTIKEYKKPIPDPYPKQTNEEKIQANIDEALALLTGAHYRTLHTNYQNKERIRVILCQAINLIMDADEEM